MMQSLTIIGCQICFMRHLSCRGGFISSETGNILALNECCPLPESANEAARSLGADKNGVIALWG